MHTCYINAAFAVGSDWRWGNRDWITRQLEDPRMVVAGRGRAHN